MKKHKHIWSPAPYIREFLGAKVFPNAQYGQVVKICIKCYKYTDVFSEANGVDNDGNLIKYDLK